MIEADILRQISDTEKTILPSKIPDSYPEIRFVASGSAAALKMKSRESGAGRFTDFILPPHDGEIVQDRRPRLIPSISAA